MSEYQTVQFGGGLNTIDTPLNMPPGELVIGQNYEIPATGGYRRIDGYSRFDGRLTYADVIEVPGEGKMLGVTMYLDTVYAFRNVVGSTAAKMFASGGAGWVEVDLGSEITFNAGTNEITEGDTVTGLTSSATATAKRIIVESGSWTGNDAVGRIILYGITGTFQNAESLQVSAVTMATSTSADIAVTLQPNGTYEFEIENFYGHAGGRRLYGVDGKSYGFDFDGTTFTQIHTGMTLDAPTHLADFRNHLFYSFDKGSVQHSSTGEPYQWSAITGASEIGLGDEVVAFKVEIDESLFIFGATRIKRLTGSSVANWDLKIFSRESGAKAGTIQRIGRTFFIDERGLIDLTSSQRYGDFSGVMASEKIEDAFNRKLNNITVSVVSKSKNQYRVFFGDKTGIQMTVKGDRIAGFMVLSYRHVIRCITSEERSDGTEEIYFGSDDGYIRRLDYGISFDGDEIEALLRFPYHDYKTPHKRKRFRSVKLDLDAESSSTIEFSVDFGYGSPSIPSSFQNTITLAGGGGFWGLAVWNAFAWSVQPFLDAYASVDGVSENMSVLFYSKTATDQPHTLFSMLVRYDYRGAVR